MGYAVVMKLAKGLRRATFDGIPSKYALLC
jgi:hypothetical protein